MSSSRPSRRTPGICLAILALYCALALLIPRIACAANLVVQQIRPSEADPAITRFDDPNYVVFDEQSSPESQLVVFMPGTDGKPGNAALLLRQVASQGYRVIGLEYNDDPAVVHVCPQSLFPTCSGNFRQRRIFGGDVKSVVENTQSETIISRLVNLLRYLEGHDAARHWDGYLSNGEPNWSRIVVSGLSQGAGMAAYIAKRRSVARVVLFSSPWDFQRSSQRLVRWDGIYYWCLLVRHWVSPGKTSPCIWICTPT